MKRINLKVLLAPLSWIGSILFCMWVACKPFDHLYDPRQAEGYYSIITYLFSLIGVILIASPIVMVLTNEEDNKTIKIKEKSKGLGWIALSTILALIVAIKL